MEDLENDNLETEQVEAPQAEKTEDVKPKNFKDEYDQAWDLAVEEQKEKLSGDKPEQKEVIKKPKKAIDKNEKLDAKEPEGVEEDEDAHAPQSWGKDKREAWKAIPKEARAVIKERESQLLKLVTQKATELDKTIQPIKTALQELEPYAKQWALEDTPKTREQGILRAVNVYNYIKDTDKLELAKAFLKASGQETLDLRETANPQGKDLDLHKKIEMLESRLAERENHQQQTETEFQTRAQTDYLVTEYNKFANTKNVYGEPKYPQASNPNFEKALGSLVVELSEKIPGRTLSEYMLTAYKELGGQIQSGTNQAPSSQKNTINRQTVDSNYQKAGARMSSAPSKYGSYDDAWEATLREFGLSD